MCWHFYSLAFHRTCLEHSLLIPMLRTQSWSPNLPDISQRKGSFYSFPFVVSCWEKVLYISCLWSLIFKNLLRPPPLFHLPSPFCGCCLGKVTMKPLLLDPVGTFPCSWDMIFKWKTFMWQPRTYMTPISQLWITYDVNTEQVHPLILNLQTKIGL